MTKFPTWLKYLRSDCICISTPSTVGGVLRDGQALASALSYHAAITGKPYKSRDTLAVTTIDFGDYEVFCNHLEKLGGIVGTSMIYDEKLAGTTYLWEEGFCIVYVRSSGKYVVSNADFVTTDENLYQSLTDLMGQTKVKTAKPNRILVITSSKDGLGSQYLDAPVASLIRENYDPNVLVGFNYIEKDLRTLDPKGRLAILDGPPGTGKTYLLRALFQELPNVNFLLIPANLVPQLSGPDFLTFLLKQRKELQDSKEPLVLVIEDADSALSYRASDNISSISTLLNLSDGIIGRSLDLRIVCTTNVTIDNIDPAILRPGRLSARVEIGFLDHQQSDAVYARLKPGVTHHYKPGSFHSLAQIYQDALETDSVSDLGIDESLPMGYHSTPVKTRNPVGFQPILNKG